MSTYKGPYQVGRRVVLARTVDRFPHFTARAGLTGKIVHYDHRSASVKLDVALKGCEEWDNCIHWEQGADNFVDFAGDVRVGLEGGEVIGRPFPHYQRKADGTTYFQMNGELHSAPTLKDGVGFDIESALPLKEWESGELPPIVEVSRALGLPYDDDTHQVLVSIAFNELGAEYRASVDDDVIFVTPRTDASSDDGLAWTWRAVGDSWVGDDRLEQNTHKLMIAANGKPADVAKEILTSMRVLALRRAQWLSDFAEKCVKHIEATSATSPETVVGPWAVVKHGEAYDEAWKLANTWRRR